MLSKSESRTTGSNAKAALIVNPFLGPKMSPKRASQKAGPNLIPGLRRTRLTVNQAYYNLFVRLVMP